MDADEAIANGFATAEARRPRGRRQHRRRSPATLQILERFQRAVESPRMKPETRTVCRRGRAGRAPAPPPVRLRKSKVSSHGATSRTWRLISPRSRRAKAATAQRATDIRAVCTASHRVAGRRYIVSAMTVDAIAHLLTITALMDKTEIDTGGREQRRPTSAAPKDRSRGDLRTPPPNQKR